MLNYPERYFYYVSYIEKNNIFSQYRLDIYKIASLTTARQSLGVGSLVTPFRFLLKRLLKIYLEDRFEIGVGVETHGAVGRFIE